MLNINIKVKNRLNIGHKVKKPLLIVVLVILMSFKSSKHPFYLGVIDIKQSKQTSALTISVKLFTNDFEDALSKQNNYRVDLINPKQKSSADSLVKKYILSHFWLQSNSKKLSLNYIGYEKEEDVIWAYFEREKIVPANQLSIYSSLLYDYFPGQTIIIHADINDAKRSGKLNNPNTKLDFIF